MIEFKNLRVLFLEDNLYQARLTITIIETYLHCQVHHVTTLKDAIETLAHESFDVVLLDLMLPDASGLESLKNIQQRFPLLPIIILTGQVDEHLAQDAVEAGAQDFIQKSNLDPELLRRSIRYAILRHQTQIELRRIKEQQIDELKKTLRRMEQMNWDGIPVHPMEESSGAVPLRKRDPDSFARITNLYLLLLQDFIMRVAGGKSVFGIGASLGVQLMELRANPNDVNELHLAAIELSLRSKSAEEKKSIRIDARMFALEVMGHLAESYRKEFVENKIR